MIRLTEPIRPERHVIISDLDGVLVDWTAGLCRWAGRELGVTIAPKQVANFHTENDIVREWYQARFGSVLPAKSLPPLLESFVGDIICHSCCMRPEFFSGLHAYPTVLHAYRAWQQRGGALRFLSSRHDEPEIFRQSRRWLECMGLPPLALAHASTTEKVLALRQPELDYRRVLIDDAPHVLNAYLKRVSMDLIETGAVQFWLVDRPWNQEVDEDPSRRAYRVTEEELYAALAG